MASVTPPIELRLLGSVDLWSPDGIAATRVLSQPKRLALLAYVATARPRGFHRRDNLVALFWPELNQEHARAALRNSLHFLRRALGDDVIVTRGDEVAVDVAALWCDVTTFETALDAGDPERALTLYRGELLTGLHVSGAPEFDHWVEAERDRVRRRARDGAWRLAGTNGNPAAGIATTHWMRVALDIDPDDEAGLHRLLHALEGAGDVPGAMREYERFARRLAADYELEPSPDTRALAAAIRARADVRTGRDTAPSSREAAPTSVVVLPFRTLGTEPQDDHHGDGLAEEITVSLSTIPGLRVIAHSSSARLRSTTKNPQTIGAELNVQYVVDGTVSRDGERLRVAARLTDAATGAIVWAETYVGAREDVFAIQEQVTRAIGTNLEIGRAADRAEHTRSRHQRSVHAYDCYHRAMQELARYSVRGLARALELARNGLALVGENDLLLATVAYIYIRFLELGVKPDRRYLDKAEAFANRALRADPASSLGHVVQGLVSYKRGDIAGSAQNLKRALEIDPNQRDALFWLSIVYLITGQTVAARPLLTRLLDIDPLTPVNHCRGIQKVRCPDTGACTAWTRVTRSRAGSWLWSSADAAAGERRLRSSIKSFATRQERPSRATLCSSNTPCAETARLPWQRQPRSC